MTGKRYIWLVSLSLAGALSPEAAVKEATSSAPVQIDGFLAAVNDRIITEGEVLNWSLPDEQKLRRVLFGRELEARILESRRKALQGLIERALILEESERLEMQIPPRVVETQVNRIIGERFEGNRTKFFNALYEERLTYEEFRRQTEDSLRVQILREQEVGSRVLVSPSEVRKAYDERQSEFKQPEMVQLRVIVLQPGGTDAERKAKLEEASGIRGRLEKGADFKTMARTLSEGFKKEDGGDWGWLRLTDLKPALSLAVSRLQPGQLSPVVDGGDELYIVRLEARRNATMKTFEEVFTTLRKELEREADKRLYDQWIGKLKLRHHVRMLSDRYAS